MLLLTYPVEGSLKWMEKHPKSKGSHNICPCCGSARGQGQELCLMGCGHFSSVFSFSNLFQTKYFDLLDCFWWILLLFKTSICLLVMIDGCVFWLPFCTWRALGPSVLKQESGDAGLGSADGDWGRFFRTGQ